MKTYEKLELAANSPQLKMILCIILGFDITPLAALGDKLTGAISEATDIAIQEAIPWVVVVNGSLLSVGERYLIPINGVVVEVYELFDISEEMRSGYTYSFYSSVYGDWFKPASAQQTLDKHNKVGSV